MASVSPCVAMSSSVSTFVISSTPSPAKAMLVTLSFSVSAKIQPDTISTNATAVILSSRVSGPIAASAVARGGRRVGRRAHAGREELRDDQRQQRGSPSAPAPRPSTSHLPKPISSPNSRAIWTPIGLADVAVIHSADETARLAMPQNIR